jgi:hypothetical protein
LFDRLQNNPPPLINIHTSIVKQIKFHVKTLPCLGIPSDNAFKIVETDASEIGFGGILVLNGILNKLFDSILDPGILRSLIIALLRKKFFLLFYALQNFNPIYSIKDFY